MKKPCRIFLLSALLILSFSCTGCSLLKDAATLNNEGVAYAKAGNYAQAYEKYQKAAEKGLVIAKNNLGLLYVEGNYVPKNPYIAGQYFLEAAQEGHVSAMYNYGLYLWYYGAESEKANALAWIQNAAFHGNGLANQFLQELRQREYQKQQEQYQREQAEQQAQFYRNLEEQRRQAEEATRLAQEEQKKKARAKKKRTAASSTPPNLKDSSAWQTPPVEPKDVEKL